MDDRGALPALGRRPPLNERLLPPPLAVEQVSQVAARPRLVGIVLQRLSQHRLQLPMVREDQIGRQLAGFPPSALRLGLSPESVEKVAQQVVDKRAVPHRRDPAARPGEQRHPLVQQPRSQAVQGQLQPRIRLRRHQLAQLSQAPRRQSRPLHLDHAEVHLRQRKAIRGRPAPRLVKRRQRLLHPSPFAARGGEQDAGARVRWIVVQAGTEHLRRFLPVSAPHQQLPQLQPRGVGELRTLRRPPQLGLRLRVAAGPRQRHPHIVGRRRARPQRPLHPLQPRQGLPRLVLYRQPPQRKRRLLTGGIDHECSLV